MKKSELRNIIRDELKKLKTERYYIPEYGNSYLFESSLSRIWQHSQKGFIVMSAFRGSNMEENMSKHKQLKSELKSLKLGFFEVDGTYKYNDGTVESELSLFIPFYDKMYSIEEFEKIGIKLGKKFKQESVLFSDGEAMYLLYNNGKKVKIGSKVSPDKVSTAYSKLRNGNHKGRTFIIEGNRIPENHVNAYTLKNEGTLF